MRAGRHENILISTLKSMLKARVSRESGETFIFSTPYLNISGFCNVTWDGALCWDHTASGTEARQACPAYVKEMNAGDNYCTAVYTCTFYFVIL